MIQANTEIEQFLLWFSKIEALPLKTRRDFFAHVMKVGGLDEKAQKFIDNTLEYLDKRDAKKINVLQQKINLMRSASAIQAKPELSIKEKLVKGVTNWMNDKVDNFKSTFYTKEAKKMQTVEFAEKSREISEVEALKAALI